MNFEWLNKNAPTVKTAYESFKKANGYIDELQGKDLVYFELRFMATYFLLGRCEKFEEIFDTDNQGIKERIEKSKNEMLVICETRENLYKAKKRVAYDILIENIDLYIEFMEREKERRIAKKYRESQGKEYKPLIQMDGIFDIEEKQRRKQTVKESFLCCI